MIAEGWSRLDAEAELSDGRTFEAVLLKPAPRPPRWGLHRCEGDPRPVLIVDSRDAAKAAEAKLTGYLVCLWPTPQGRWTMLEPLRDRALLLWPTVEGLDAMERLELVLTDPAGLGCTGKLVVPSDAAPWDDTAENLVAWAKARVRPLNQQQQVADGAQPALESVAATAQAEVNAAPPAPLPPAVASPADAGIDEGPPPSDFPPEASQERPRKPKRRLQVVGGAAIDAMESIDPDAPPIPHELSESGIAAHFVMLHRDKFRAVHEWGGRHGPCWMVWNGTRWAREPNRVTAMQDGRALAHGVKFWDAARGVTELSKVKWESKKFIGAFLDLASYAPEIIAAPDTFDAEAHLLGCPSCTIDLRTGEAHEPRLEDYITRATSVDPAPGPMPWWERVIERASRGDDSVLSYIHRWCGYLLLGGENVEEAFLFVYGAGASGKSKFLTPLQEILGTGDIGYFRKADKEVFTHSGDKNTNIGEKIARLQGARLVTCSELEEGSRWKESLLKDFTGRERVEGRALYAQTTEYNPSFRLIFSGNHKPALRSVGEEIKRRLHLLEFPGTIPEEDRIKDLPERLRAEYPAILHWMIQGAIAYQDAGLGKPEQIIDATQEYLTDEDTLAAWFDSCCESDMHERTLVGEAYKSFADMAKAEGEHYILSKKRFSQRMADRGYKSVKRGGVRMFDGFRLKVQPIPHPQGWQP